MYTNAKGLAIAVSLVLMLAAPAWAIPPLGAPTGYLNEGQVSVGAEYSYSKQNMDITTIGPIYGKCFGEVTFRNGIRDATSNAIYGNIGLGLSDSEYAWDLFMRVGAADMDFEKHNEDYLGYVGDSGYGFSIGGGTRVTCLRTGRIDWGLLGQVTWTDLGEFGARSYDCYSYPEYGECDGECEISMVIEPYRETFTLDAEGEMLEIQLAFGPTIPLTPPDGGFQAEIFGGPCAYFMTGNIDAEVHLNGYDFYNKSADIDEEMFGGFFGGRCTLDSGVSAFVEGQFYEGDCWAIGAGLMFPL